MTPRKFANLIYAWCIPRIGPSEDGGDSIADWEAELVDLLPWQSTASEAAAELESASFMEMMAKQGSG